MRLVTLPERLYEVRKAAIVRAEVTGRGNDGTVRLTSSEGEITIRTERPDQFALGERVEVRLQPGRPPQNAEIRTVRSDPTQPRSAQTDIDVHVSPPSQEESKPLEDKVFGKIVRAVPLRPGEALLALPPATEQIESIVQPVTPCPAFSPENFLEKLPSEALKRFISIKAETIARTITLAPAPLSALPDSVLTKAANALSVGQTKLNSPPQGAEVGRILKGVLGLERNGLQFASLPRPGSTLSSSEKEGRSLSFQVGAITTTPAPLVFEDYPDHSPLRFPPPGLRAGELAAQVLGPVDGKDALAVTIVFPADEDGQPRYYALLEPGFTLTPGSRIELTPLPVLPGTRDASAQATPQTAAAFPPPVLSALPLGIPYFLNAETWPVLQEIVNLLPQVSPQFAQAFINMIPNPATPQQIAPAALFFIAAMRIGDVEGWLGGRAVDAIRRAGRGDILTRLTQESGVLSRLSGEPLGQEWRATSLPLFWDGEIFRLPLYYKRQEEERGTGRENGQAMMRFIINLDLSRMGKLQMDALYREQAKRFDLILRSARPFTKAAEHEMRGLFAGALEDIGLRGEMGFQSGSDKWVTVQPDRLYEFSQSF